MFESFRSQKPQDPLPRVPDWYWQLEFTHAYGSVEGQTTDWDGKAYTYWNNLLNALAKEGESL